MAKVTLIDLANLNNKTTATNTININNDRIETAFDNTLSRDGTTPNTMEASIDMNSFPIYNLPKATSDTEPLRKKEFDELELAQDVTALLAAVAETEADRIAAAASAATATAQAAIAVQAAEDAASVASSSASFATRTAAAAATISVATQFVTTFGYATNGDGGGGRYAKVGSEPTHGGKFQSADGAWWELREFYARPKMFGALLDGTTDDLAALQLWVNYSAAFKCVAAGNNGTAAVPTGSLNYVTGARIECAGEMTLLRATQVVEPLVLASTIDSAYVKGLKFSYTAGTSSASNVTMALGVTAFTITAGLGFLVNQFVIIRPTAQQQHYLIARVNSYVGTTLTVDVTTVTGSGTYNSWYMQSYTDSSGGGYTPAAIRFDFCTKPTCIENQFDGRFFIAIGIKNTSQAVISRNRIVGASDRGVENNSLTGASNINIDNVISDNYIDGSGWTFYGINCGADGGNQTKVIISNNEITNTLVHGASISGQLYRAQITNNNIKMFASGPGSYGVGILTQSLGAQFTLAPIISGNQISGGVYSIFMLDPINFVVTNNSGESAGAAGIHVSSPTSSAGISSTISNNSIRLSGGNGIELIGNGSFPVVAVAISGNGTSNNAGWGILTNANTSGCVIAANTNYANSLGTISMGGANFAGTNA